MAVDSSQPGRKSDVARGSATQDAPGPSGATRAERPSRLPCWLRAWVQRFERSIAGHTTQLLRDIVIIDKSMIMAAISFLSFVPLLIVLAAIFPITEIHDFSGTLRALMGLDAPATEAVRGLFAPAGRVARTTTVASLVIVIVSAYAFVANLQQTYELIWRKTRTRRVHSFVRRWVWLGGFLGFGLVLALIDAALGNGTGQQVLVNVVGFVLAVGFFTWSLHLLLGGRVRWIELLPGGIATTIGETGLRFFSIIVFSPMVVSNADAYGPIGVVFVLMSWLIGACVVLVGGPVVGFAISRRLFHYP
jgi:membrane protein